MKKIIPLRVLLILPTEEMLESIRKKLVSELDLELFDVTAAHLPQERARALYPLGRTCYDFVCVFVASADARDVMKVARRLVTGMDRVLLVAPADTRYGGKVPLCSWEPEDSRWPAECARKLGEAALRQQLIRPNPIEKLRRAIERLRLHKGVAGLIFCAIAAATTGVGYVDKVQRYASRNIPHEISEYAGWALGAFTLGLTVIGAWLIAVRWVYEVLLEKTRIRGKVAAGLSLVAIVAVASLQFLVQPEAPRHRHLYEQLRQTCTTKLWESTATGGAGFHVVSPKPQATKLPPVQVWTSVQCIAGLASQGVPLNESQRSMLRLQFAWMETNGIPSWSMTYLAAPLRDAIRHRELARLTGDDVFEDPEEFAELLRSRGNANSQEIDYILQNTHRRSGSGWGYFEGWKPGITEISAWVTVAQSLCVNADVFTPPLLSHVSNSIVGNLRFIRSRSIDRTGETLGISPVPWNESVRNLEDLDRTYSAAMSLWAHLEFLTCSSVGWSEAEMEKARNFVRRHLAVLIQHASETNLWVPNYRRHGDQTEVFIGLVGQVLHIVNKGLSLGLIEQGPIENLRLIKRAFLRKINESPWDTGRRPVNKNDRMHDGDRYLLPVQQAVEASTYLWFPWTLLACSELMDDSTLTNDDRLRARRRFQELVDRLPEMRNFVEREYNYVLAETLYCIGRAGPAIARLDAKDTNSNP